MVRQQIGERNFHSFYQILSGLDNATIQEWDLSRNYGDYFYLNQGKMNNATQVFF